MCGVDVKGITIKGARSHNLKGIDLEIPRNRLVVITGLSGSGKSSLAFDTIYAEGQRRYVESLSSYARQFLDRMEKPDVDLIEGLSPAIAIEQKTTHRNPRSTVATVTEIYDYLRILFARAGEPHCPECGKAISSQSPSQIAETLSSLPDGSRISICAPVIRDKKGEFKNFFSAYLAKGFVRAFVDGDAVALDDPPVLEKNIRHRISLIIDRVKINAENRSRIAESVELALKLADGLLEVIFHDTGKTELYSEHFACPDCKVSIPSLEPRNFSFNSPHGACPRCHGLGKLMEFDEDLIVNPGLSIREGALLPLKNPGMGYRSTLLKTVAANFGFDFDTPFGRLPEKAKHAILYGTDSKLDFVYESRKGSRYQWRSHYEGLIPMLQRRYGETASAETREDLERFMSARICPSCKGRRLRPEILAVTVNGRNIMDFTELSVEQAVRVFQSLELSDTQKKIADKILKEIVQRLEFLNDVGLSYLTLDRAAGTLSGGESQRIRLATQIGSKLMGVVYVLDEPSIGLHQRDNQRLIHTLEKMRDLGNTVIVVEHDQETIDAADFVVDLGPGAGKHGGEVVCLGKPEEIRACPRSLTGMYLSGKKSIPVPEKRRKPSGWLTVRGAALHNLRGLDVRFPLGVFTCVTGVSGSGKSTLVNEILRKALWRKLGGRSLKGIGLNGLAGAKQVDKIISIDQSPIGRTPRSNPATYTGLFTPIRELFAQTPEARARGYKPGRFSFNVKGGRCEACRGDGLLKIEMHFLPDVYVTCEQCGGRRYNRETLEVRYKGKNIADVLEMTIEEALDFFRTIPKIRKKLQTLFDVGLSYVSLGQPATTLSGGEAQRIKLARELSKRATGQTLYVLDEPTTGLHFDDVAKLLSVLNRLVDAGNTVVVVEHNLDVIKNSDYVIDLGPEGGDGGGKLVAAGTPEKIVSCRKSFTGQFLKKVLRKG
ncbi:MAG: excinuclease ABC subunit UvrA [Acidobacteria bacterium]|nr:excinuclease ABC subunit UvrA [Acidobacteriota bacterium]